MLVPRSITGNKGLATPHGFTLMELLVVLSIMLILSGIVALAVTPAMRNASLRAGTLMVIAELQFARSYAISNQTETAVQFDNQNHGISVVTNAKNTTQNTTQNTNPALDATPDAAQGSDGSITWQTVSTPAGRYRALPSGTTIKAVDVTAATGAATGAATPEPLISFSPLGQADAATVILQDDQGLQRIIQVNALTGRCDIMDNQNGQISTKNQ